MSNLYVKKSLIFLVAMSFVFSQKGFCSDSPKTLNALITKGTDAESLVIENKKPVSVEHLNDDFNMSTREFYELDLIAKDDYNVASASQEKPEENTTDSAESNIYKVNISSGNLNATKLPSNVVLEVSKFISQGKYPQAETLLDRNVSEFSFDTCSLVQAAGLYEKIKRYPKAISLYEKALASSPERIEFLYNYSLCLYKANQIAKAKSNFSKIISLNPSFMLAHYNLGNIYYKQANYYKALEYFVKSTEINPLSTDAFFNAGMTLEALHYQDLAYKYYGRCLKLNPDDRQALAAIKRLRGIA